MSGAASSPNFGHLAATEPLLAHLGAKAERYVFADPPTALFKLRQLGEVLAQRAAAATGLYTAPGESQVDLLRRLRDAGVLDREVGDMLHALRVTGNTAVHDATGAAVSRRDALRGLRLGWRLCTWFQRAFADPGFHAGAFIPPPNPGEAEQALKDELRALREAVAQHEIETRQLAADAAETARQLSLAEERAAAAYDELDYALQLAGETEAKAAHLEAEYAAKLAALQAQAAAAPKPDVDAVLARVRAATEGLDLDESETRLLIDAQLRAAGWEADSVALRYAAGARPETGRAMALAEWPTRSGPADYVLFLGLTPVAVVEAKRKKIDVSGALQQAKRYARDYVFTAEPEAPGAPWGDCVIPFLFATNGRPYLRQLRTKSGIWFHDIRRPANHPRALEGWYSPDGLRDLLTRDHAAADERLRTEASDYLELRDYQRAAIAAVEDAIAHGQADILLAMATGTGKTRVALSLIYRLLKAGRFRRVLFLVDRSALGVQALNAFGDVKLEQREPLTRIYDVKGLGDLRPDPDTRVHVATVQGMVKRLLYPSDGDAPLPVDAYDCVIVDECHRGYNLDRELSDTELEIRSEADYISKYRRVLDHFDAVRVGLTATPALHTTQIFGAPVFSYGYRQAVIDGHLIDYEPPYNIATHLNTSGIHWRPGDEVARFDTATQQLDLFRTPDEIDIEVDGFNTRVVTEPFNRVVCDTLARHIDPALPGKTLVFCANDAHADLVVTLLKESFTAVHGPIDDDTVQKITGSVEDPLASIRHFKGERLPRVVVTVDLLTTGIDVPEITTLVFIRRVKSRILYDQMVGRATRRCDAIGKETFRIYDAVRLYEALAPYTEMKPVVTRPKLTFTQLVDELLTVDDDAHRRAVLDALTAKLQAKKRRLTGAALDGFQTLAGCDPEALLTLLRAGDVPAAAAFFTAHDGVAQLLDDLSGPGGEIVFVSDAPDRLLGVTRGFGDADRPEDYLEGFRAFIEANRNHIDALVVVTTRPRELTRAQLRELRLRLDQAGYSETALRTAWSQVSNQDVAASIVGFIRQQALGSPLVPYAERVDRALRRLLASQPFTPPQRQWLERIGQQMTVETIVDRDALDRGQFKADGGFRRLDRVFEGDLERLLDTLREAVWQDAG
ncbi:MAG: type I restriction-modification system endonuclease [Deltaproteobacteria bacterium]|nr:MAG: type I restriction-modification system endonuclease [Deltaproteobacteria bacterium]